MYWKLYVTILNLHDITIKNDYKYLIELSLIYLFEKT